MKIACTVWSWGKLRDYFKELPITIFGKRRRKLEGRRSTGIARRYSAQAAKIFVVNKRWAEKVSILRDMSVDVLENKWTAEEFASELEKMKTHESEYSHTLRDSKSVAQHVEDSMLIYKIMGHEQDCSALAFAELEKYDYGYSEDRKIELREMHGIYRYRVLGYGVTKSDTIERYKNQDRHKEKKNAHKEKSVQNLQLEAQQLLFHRLQGWA